MIKRTESIVIVIVIVIVLVDGETADSPGKPAGFLSLDDVTAVEVDWSFQFTREAECGLERRVVGA